MACFCCFNPQMDPTEKPLVVDINKILQDKAWSMYKASLSSWGRRCLQRKKFYIEVPEEFFTFQQIGQTEYKPRNGHLELVKPGASKPDGKPEQAAGKLEAGDVTANNNTEVQEQGFTTADVASPECVTVNTVFTNETTSTLKYNFRFEKQRTAEVSISFQKGFTFGASTNFKVGLPLTESEFGTEANIEYNVTSTHEQTFTETTTTEATSEISVSPSSKYVAQMQLDEKKVFADFKTRMRMSMPQGRAPISIKLKSDDSIAAVLYVTNLRDDVMYDDDGEKLACAEEVKGHTDQVDFVVEGVIRGSLAANHRIHLKNQKDGPEQV